MQTKEQVEINYVDYEKLIAGRAWCWTKKTGGDFEDFQELRAEGNLIFCKIQKNFDPLKSSFSTYLTNSLNFHFRNIARKAGRPEFVEIGDEVSSEGGSPEKAAALKEMIRRLKKDARFLVESVLETPSGLIWMLRGRKKRATVTRYALQKYLIKKKGWTESRCWRAFDQIKAALSTL